MSRDPHRLAIPALDRMIDRPEPRAGNRNTPEARALVAAKRDRILAALSLAGEEGLGIRALAARVLSRPFEEVSQTSAANALRSPLRGLRKRGEIALVGSTTRARYVLAEYASREPEPEEPEPLDLRSLARGFASRHGLSGDAALDLLDLLEAVAEREGRS